MNTKQRITRSTIIFAALTIAGVIITASAKVITDAFSQTVMIAFGSVIFGAGLIFFLVRIATLNEK